MLKRAAGIVLIAVGLIRLIYQVVYAPRLGFPMLSEGALFWGVYLISANISFAILKRKLFYINLIAILGMYFIAIVLGGECALLLLWRMNQPAIFDLSGLFSMLPGNNLSFLSQYSPDWLNTILCIVYKTGYFSPLFIPVLCNICNCEFKRAWQYFFSGHFLQFFLMMPLFMLFSVKEVWYVTGIPDGLQRVFASETIKLFTVSWCFPSMHTSIAMASFLVARQEPNKLFRYCWCSYCIAVIISTLWFPIHWTMDVGAGLLVGYVAFRLTKRMVVSEVFLQNNAIVRLKNC